MVLMYNGKGDTGNSINYRGKKLMSRTMKLWARIIDKRLRSGIDITANQYGFILGKSTNTVFLLRQLVEKYRKEKIFTWHLLIWKRPLTKLVTWWCLREKMVCVACPCHVCRYTINSSNF